MPMRWPARSVSTSTPNPCVPSQTKPATAVANQATVGTASTSGRSRIRRR